MTDKNRATIICVCNEASKEECRLCFKRHEIKPDIKINAPAWPRK
jgi:hypothetical protein